ncbi:hypothetical protein D3C78_1529390 [compost metagenome]
MKCARCKQEKESTKKRRTNTAYVEDELNFVTECDECFEETESYWEQMWKENSYGSY